jgi:homoserine dehydrogenase
MRISTSAAVAGDPDHPAAARVASAATITSVIGTSTARPTSSWTGWTPGNASFDEALAEAQELGFAEADPTADVEGFDAAAKAAILASLAFHSRVRAADVYREGITEVTTADVASAREIGCVVKLLAICQLSPAGPAGEERTVSVRVHPAMIPRSHPLASVGGAYNAIFVESQSAGRLMFYGPGAGGSPTASAVLGDLVTVARNRLRGAVGLESRARGPSGGLDRQRRHPLSPLLEVADVAGVLATIAQSFAEHDIDPDGAARTGEGPMPSWSSSPPGHRCGAERNSELFAGWRPCSK